MKRLTHEQKDKITETALKKVIEAKDYHEDTVYLANHPISHSKESKERAAKTATHLAELELILLQNY